mmetsp:Transcript_41618/g.50635  ORF Transcript_41618/g.50635 Transcript_41618/m.50635 type:complete len:324 (-) Transcript_41618:335-1306(-)
MIRASPIISQNFRSTSSNKQPPVIQTRFRHSLRILRHYFQVLRGDIIRYLDTLLHALTNHRKTLRQRLPRRTPIRFRQTLQLPPQRLIHPLHNLLTRPQQNRPRHNIMLRLRNQIRRHHLPLRTLVTNHQHLARTRQHINPTIPTHHALRRRHPFVPRTNNHVARGYRRIGVGGGETVRHGVNRLGAADTEEKIDGGDVRGGEGYGGRVGGGEGDGGAAGSAGGDGGHYDGGGERVASSRRVAACRTARTDCLARHASRNGNLAFIHAVPLHFRKGFHAGVDVDEGATFLVGQTVERGLAFFLGDDVAGALGGYVAEFLGEGD